MPLSWDIKFFPPFGIKLGSVSQYCLNLCNSMDSTCQASLSITSSQSLHKLMSIESVMPSNHLILCHPLLLLPSIFPSIRIFSSESILHIRWPKYCSFSFSISPFNEYPGLVSFGINWFGHLQSEGHLRVFSNTIAQKHQFFGTRVLYGPTLTSIYDY